MTKILTAKRDITGFDSQCQVCHRPILKGEKYVVHNYDIGRRLEHNEKCPPKPTQRALIIYGDTKGISELADTIDSMILLNKRLVKKFEYVVRVNGGLDWNEGTCYHCNIEVATGPRPVHCPKCGRRVDAS